MQRGFSLVELAVTVGIIATLLLAGAAFALGTRAFAMGSAATEFEAQLQAARSLAATSANGATIVIQPRFPAGRTTAAGFKSVVYVGRPTGAGALSAGNVAPVSSDADVSEGTLGAPPFAIFISASGHVSMQGSYPSPAQFDSAAVTPIAGEPVCPGAGNYTLTFTANGASRTLVLPCGIALGGTPIPFVTNTPSASLTPSPAPSSTPTPCVAGCGTSTPTPSPTPCAPNCTTPTPTPTPCALNCTTPTPTPSPTAATFCAPSGGRCFWQTLAPPPMQSGTGTCQPNGFALTWACKYFGGAQSFGYADPPYATGYTYEIQTQWNIVNCDSQSQCFDGFGGDDIAVDNPAHYMPSGFYCTNYTGPGLYQTVDLTTGPAAPVDWSAQPAVLAITASGPGRFCN